MSVKYSDQEISDFIKEPKHLDNDYGKKFQLRNKRGHKEREINLEGASGNQYRLILRQSSINPLDFSIILSLCPSGSAQIFRLRRYNGKSHEHTNKIEDVTFYDFHIHSATERYQELGLREDAFAEPSDSYVGYESAISYMLSDCGVKLPKTPQKNLFDEV